MCRAFSAKRTQQMVREFDKKTCAIHILLFADWAQEAKNAQVTARSDTFDTLTE